MSFTIPQAKSKKTRRTNKIKKAIKRATGEKKFPEYVVELVRSECTRQVKPMISDQEIREIVWR